MIQILDKRTQRFVEFLDRIFPAEVTVKLSILNGYDALSSDETKDCGFAVYIPSMKNIMLPMEVPESIIELGDKELIPNFVIHNLAHEYAHFLQHVGLLEGYNDDTAIEKVANCFADEAVKKFKEEESRHDLY